MTGARARGFTLLEAIIALVIFSMGAVALYGWLAANLRTVERVQATRERASITLAALDVVRDVNPMAQATGARVAQDLRFEWKASALEGPRRSVTPAGQPGHFEVALYSVDIRVLRKGTQIGDFRVRQVGYRFIGNLDDED